MTSHPLIKLIADKNLLGNLADEYGTPTYIYSQPRLLDNINRLDKALRQNFDKYHICYAVKANSNPNLIAVMKAHLPNLGGDCASPGEIEAAWLAGIKSQDCIYTGNYESPADLQYALDSRICINLDDVSSLDRLARLKLPKRLSFRLNPGFGRGMFKQINTGGEKAKFGVPRHDIINAYSKALNLGVKRFGLQCMTGSGILDKDYFASLLTAILDSAKNIDTELGIKMEYISIGGGLGIPYQDKDQPLPIDYVMKQLGEVFYQYYDRKAIDCPALWLEPGKYIVGDSGFVLSRVTGIKKGYRTFIGLDAGMETILRPALYQAYHRFLKVGDPDANPVGKVDFTGQICENTDRQAIDRSFPSVAEGDLIAIMDAGAYGFVMSMNYNSRPRPSEVLLTESGSQLIRHREMIDDIYAKCIL